MREQKILKARDIMTTALVTLSPDVRLVEAMVLLTRRAISGVPVVDGAGRLVGILSEADCLRAVASGEFFSGDSHYEELSVQQFMTKAAYTIHPEMGIYRIAQLFLDRGVRRLPVVDGETLLGQVSRRDVLRGIEQMRQMRQPRKRYPDYPEGREPNP
jgi:CBS domain-containing protein